MISFIENNVLYQLYDYNTDIYLAVSVMESKRKLKEEGAKKKNERNISEEWWKQGRNIWKEWKKKEKKKKKNWRKMKENEKKERKMREEWRKNTQKIKKRRIEENRRKYTQKFKRIMYYPHEMCETS